MITIDLEELIPRKYLDSCPVAGSGLNRHLYKTALSLKNWCTFERAFDEILAMAIAAGRAPGRKTENEVRRAIDRAWGSEGQRQAAPKVEPDLSAINRIVREGNANGSAYQRLIDSSPIRTQPEKRQRLTFAILARLFPGDPYLCLGKGTYVHDCKRLSDWRAATRLFEWELIVPSPQLGPTGRTDDDKESTHALSNCGRRRFLVAEFDFSRYARDGVTPTEFKPLIDAWGVAGIAVKDAQAAIILYLAKATKPILVVDSKGKSLHAWYFVEGFSEDIVLADFNTLRSLGADSATWTRSQFVRLPDGTRSNGERQSVLYLDHLNNN